MTEMTNTSDSCPAYLEIEALSSNTAHIRDTCTPSPSISSYVDSNPAVSHTMSSRYDSNIFQPWQSTTDIPATFIQPLVSDSRHTDSSIYSMDKGYHFNNTDAEVTFFNTQPRPSWLPHLWHQERSSSTETTMSTSSTSSIYSQGSSISNYDNALYNNDPHFRYDSPTSSFTSASMIPSQPLASSKTIFKKKTHINAKIYKRYPKPPYTYQGMVITAIMNSPGQALSLSGVHAKLSELFVFFRGDYKGWKDSVRHNLSKNSCFNRENEPHYDEYDKTGRRKEVYKWRVDLTDISPEVFRRQDNPLGMSGQYKLYVHKHLNLPPVELPSTPRLSVLAGEIDSYYSCEVTPNKDYEQSKKRKVPIKDSSIQQPTQSYSYNEDHISMVLPVVSACSVLTESPEQFNGRCQATQSYSQSDIKYEDTTPLKRDEEHSTKRRRLSYDIESLVNGPDNDTGVQQIFNYVIYARNEHSSTDAIENLSMLCLTSDDSATTRPGGMTFKQEPSDYSPMLAYHDNE